MGELTEEEIADNETWVVLVAAYRQLKKAKPENRSERARRYAVTITEMEKALAYFNTMVLHNFGD